MDRTVKLPGPNETGTLLRFSHRASRRIEEELKSNINGVFKRLGAFAEDPSWGQLAEAVAAIGIEAARESAARATPLGKEVVADLLDAAVAEVGREGVAEILRDGILKGSTKTGERAPDDDPKEKAAPTA